MPVAGARPSGKCFSVNDENAALRQKILQIERQNDAQQRRLLQLEKMVLELSSNKSPVDVLGSSSHLRPSHLTDLPHPFAARGGDAEEDAQRPTGVTTTGTSTSSSSLAHHIPNLRGDRDEDPLCDDLDTLMEEFDRIGRENGLTYGITASRSVTDSEDLAEVGGGRDARAWFGVDGVGDEDRSGEGSEGKVMPASPVAALLTPAYQEQRGGGTGIPQCCLEVGHQQPALSLQPSLTTPVLLTAEALREAEKRQQRHRQGRRRRPLPVSFSKPKFSPSVGFQPLKRWERPWWASNQAAHNKVNPFSNLLAGLNRQTNVEPTPGRKTGITTTPGRVGVVRAPPPLPHTRGTRARRTLGGEVALDGTGIGEDCPGYASPSSSSVSSASATSRVRMWSSGLRLPLLSPFPESYASDLDTHVSDEEDLVVDEVVSMSVGKPKCRQRLESVGSIGGPCIPPDLLFDTSRTSQELNSDLGEVKEEDVMTEIAGVWDDTLLVDESEVLHLHQPELEVKEEGNVRAQSEEKPLEEEDIDLLEEDTKVLESLLEEDRSSETVLTHKSNVKLQGPQSGVVGSESGTECGEKDGTSASEKVSAVTRHHVVVRCVGGGGNMNGKDGKGDAGIGRTLGGCGAGGFARFALPSKVKSVQALKDKKTLRIDGKDVKLPAGSLIVAVVNESGKLVPLPQLQVNPESLTQTISLHDKSAEEEVDIETVMEKTPVLEAGDLDSLLAQFEASEAVNKPSSSNSSTPEKVNSLYREQSMKISVPPASTSIKDSTPVASSTRATNSPTLPTHQNIKDALPKEVIEKIKASTKRKSTKILPEPVLPRKGRGAKHQESALHRNKSLKITINTTTQQNGKEKRVPPPLDHDYCFSPKKEKKTKNSADKEDTSASELFNKLPDYYTGAVKQKDSKKASISSDDSHDEGGKKDSGVESGDVSDASVETEERRKEGKDIRITDVEWDNGKVKEKMVIKQEEVDVYNKLPAYMTDIGNVKPKEETDTQVEEEEEEMKEKEEEKKAIKEEIEKQEVKKKRKLNLSEYRQRLQSAQNSRCPSPSQSESASMSNGNVLEACELVSKIRNSMEKAGGPESQVPENSSSDKVVPEDDIEEGELNGDSDPEVSVIPQPVAADANEAILEKLGTASEKSWKQEGSRIVDNNNLHNSSLSSCEDRDRRKIGSHRSSSRRWSSSSRSRSRSRTRSPALSKKHSSRSHRSSRRKRRQTHRYSQSSQSSRRHWSRSRSGSRGRSSCGSCSSYSSSSRSRSRSRSRSSKRRERWGYSRRYSRSRERRRRSRSRSRSRSSSRYSRVTRSRSPMWETSRRSRIPFRPRRTENEDRVRQVEERRVIYIGRIAEGTTKAELRHRFQKFGSIVDISVHFRERGDNYGFVTFKNRDEAYMAVEHGNDDPSLCRYDLCFGGRRAFCKVQYSDLDAQDSSELHYISGPVGGGGAPPPLVPSPSMDFDSLLRAAMKKKR